MPVNAIAVKIAATIRLLRRKRFSSIVISFFAITSCEIKRAACDYRLLAQ